MRIAILLKCCYQDPTTREVLPGLAPGDRAAVSTALQLARQGDCTTVALTAGPAVESEILVAALQAGVQRAIRLADPAVQGADLRSVAAMLAAAVHHVGFDLVLAGHRSVNWGSGATGPAVAHVLEIPHVTGVSAVERRGQELLVTHRHERGAVALAVRLPALLTTLVAPPLPPLRQSAIPTPVEELRLSELTLPFRKPFNLPGSQLAFAEPRATSMLDGVAALAALLHGQGRPLVR